jgi:hypothetical protein
MPVEKRARVEIFLPLRSDIVAYKIVAEWLTEEFAFTRGGSTLTTPFAGFYVSATQVDVVEDAIRILFCDFDLDIDDAKQRAVLIDYLEQVRALLMQALEEEEVWIIYYPISRIVS